MPLTDRAIRAAKPLEKERKLADEKGLYLLITPAGSKLWRVKFRHHGKEKKLSLRAYPEISLQDARRQRDNARATLIAGIDPALERKKAKLSARLSAATSFSDVALEYIESKMVGGDRAAATVSKARWFLEKLAPAIGDMPIASVDPQMLLAALKRLESKGRHETAKNAVRSPVGCFGTEWRPVDATPIQPRCCKVRLSRQRLAITRPFWNRLS